MYFDHFVKSVALFVMAMILVWVAKLTNGGISYRLDGVAHRVEVLK